MFRLIITAAVLLILSATAYAVENSYTFSDGGYYRLTGLKIKQGDNPEWKNASFNDDDWINFENSDAGEEEKGRWWIRVHVEVLDSITGNNILTIQSIRFFSAYNIYWDGILLGQNGKIGHSISEEKPGLFKYPIYIPQNLSSGGNHVIAIELSNYHAKSNLNGGKILLGSYFEWSKTTILWLTKFYFIIGIVFITFIFNVFLYFFSGRKISTLLFALLCITVALNAVINYYWLINDVQSSYVNVQDIWNPLTTVMIGILIPAYFVYEYDIPNRLLITGLLMFNIILLGIDINYFQRSQFVLYSVSFTSVVILLWAAVTRKKGSIISLVFLFLALLSVYYNYHFDMENLVTLSTLMIVGFDINLAREISAREKKAKQAELKSARLENELLKKDINPHFLMNSLNSVMVYLRRDPEKAVKLVTVLAEELRTISEISHLKLIPLKKEIELCNSHLTIFNYRKGSEYTLKLINVDEMEQIPPMLFHTLIENGITHGYENKNCGYFELKKESMPGATRFILFNDSNTNGHVTFNEGTGLKYVRARLEESFPKKFDLSYGPVPGGWNVIITIYKN